MYRGLKMAQKTLNTRIQLKNADLTSWNSSTLQLMAGEVALAKIETTQHDAATGTYYKVPTYLMKVGDGSHTFSELNWLAAPASDVHAWAKKAAMDYADLPQTLRDEIAALQGAVGVEGSVSTQISAAVAAAIEGLDSPDTAVAKQFVTAVAMEDGSITVTRRELSADDIPALEISKITGLQDALDAKASKEEFNALKETVGNSSSGLVQQLNNEAAERAAADEALEGKITTITDVTIPGMNTNISNNTTAAQTAQSTADEAQRQVDALEGVVETLTQTVATNKTAAEALVSTEKSEREAADGALSDAIAQLRTEIKNVSNIMNFRGAVSAKTDITDPDEGDVIVVVNTESADNGKEFVYSDGDWVEFGSVSAQDSAIATLQERMGTAEGKITSLETNSATKSELQAAQGALQDQIDTKAEQSVLNSTNDRVGALETTVGNVSGAGLVADVSAIKTTLGDGTTDGLVKDVAQLKVDSATHPTKTYVDNQDAALTGAISDEQSRAEEAERALGERIDAANTAHNTLSGRVDQAESDIDALEGEVNTIKNTTIPTLATKAEVSAVSERVAAIEEDYLKAADTYIFNCGDHTA